MKTHLVGDDCKPLLIKAGEDVTVPLGAVVVSFFSCSRPLALELIWLISASVSGNTLSEN